MSQLLARPGRSQRALKVAALLRFAIAEIFLEVLDTDQYAALGNIPAISSVRMSPDLRWANIYIIAASSADEWLAVLKAERRTLRARLAHNIDLKFVPDLRFFLDDSFDQFARVSELLNSPAVRRDL